LTFWSFLFWTHVWGSVGGGEIMVCMCVYALWLNYF
jgi:hypothetical protein